MLTKCMEGSMTSVHLNFSKYRFDSISFFNFLFSILKLTVIY